MSKMSFFTPFKFLDNKNAKMSTSKNAIPNKNNNVMMSGKRSTNLILTLNAGTKLRSVKKFGSIWGME